MEAVLRDFFVATPCMFFDVMYLCNMLAAVVSAGLLLLFLVCSCFSAIFPEKKKKRALGPPRLANHRSRRRRVNQ